MSNTFGKLLRSNGTLILLSVIIAPYLIYALVSSVPAKKIIPHSTPTKTLEEIMHSPVPVTAEPAWDTDFKSSIIEETK